MASITCGNCGGAHETVSAVRECHAAASSDRVVHPETSSAPTRSEFGSPPPPLPSAPRAQPSDSWAGPDELGRWLVVARGQEVPAAWSAAPRFVLDRPALQAADQTVERLVPSWLRRERLVIELATPFAQPAEVVRTAAWFLDAGFTFAADHLWFLLWSNSVDGRDPEHPRWAWDDTAAEIDRAAPVDGDGIWYDGGPIGRPTTTFPVVHRIHLERRLNTALGTAGPSAELAADQLAAVAHQGGAARIIAPAGSGKTRVLTERARHLLREWHLPVNALTLVAFNVRAAAEMRERTTDLPGLQVRTLNALALMIVQHVGKRRVTTIDERDVRRILDDLVSFTRRSNTDPAQAWIDALSLCRLGLRPPAEVEAMFDGEVAGFTEVFTRYREVLAERNAVDFDEQIIAAIHLLLTDAAVRAEAQRAARVLLVDEFQDLTPAHLLLLRLLASPEMAVFGVGDDDQTIYGYAGATPEWLIGFDRIFPGAADHPLHINYRCPPAVVQAATNVLTHNRRRVPKVIASAPERPFDPTALAVVAAPDTCAASVEAVASFLATGAAPADIAVLTRVNAGLAPVQVALRHQGISTQSAVDERYLERTGVRAVLAWLRVAVDPEKLRAADLDAIVRRPSRGLSGRVVEWVAECRNVASIHRLADRLTAERDSDKVHAFANDIEQLARLHSRAASTAELLQYVRNRVGLDDALAKLDRSRADSQASHLDDLDALTSLAKLHPDPSSFASWLRDELSKPGDPTGITLATVHRVKGREWPYVVVHDVRDGVMPHRLTDNVEEERRVFHVAITRASLCATVVADDVCSSSFIAELQEPYVAPAPRAGGAMSSTRSPVRAIASAPDDQQVDRPELREALRSWRKTQSAFDAVPAYVVFSNATLDAIVSIAPTSIEGLRGIPGIGPVKRDRYGAGIVDVVQQWQEAQAAPMVPD